MMHSRTDTLELSIDKRHQREEKKNWKFAADIDGVRGEKSLRVLSPERIICCAATAAKDLHFLCVQKWWSVRGGWFLCVAPPLPASTILRAFRLNATNNLENGFKRSHFSCSPTNGEQCFLCTYDVRCMSLAAA